MGAIKEHSNQIVKILICLCLTFVFIFVQPKENVQQAEAIVPLLLWGGSLIAGIVAEEVIEMGIRHYSADGKTKSKSKTKKIADEIFGEYGEYDFDFLKSNPTRKADGSLEVYPSANDRAKIARKIADEFSDVYDDDVLRTNNNIRIVGNYGVDFDIQPRTSQPTYILSDRKAYDFFVKMSDLILHDKGTYMTLEAKSIFNGYRFMDVSLGADIDTMYVHTYNPAQGRCYSYDFYNDSDTSIVSNINASCDPENINLFEKYSSWVNDVKWSGGLSVPNTIKNVYPAPKDMSPTQQLPNHADLSNKPFKLKNMFPVTSDDSDITWEVVNNTSETDNTWNNNAETNIDTYLENGDVNQNTYNTQTINNYYTDSNYPVKAEDVTIIVDTDIVVPPSDTDVDIDADGFKYCVDKSSGKVVPCKDIEAIDGGLLSYLRNSYDYAVNAVKTSVNGLETIAAGSVGLIALYSEIFDWLPDEVTVLLTSGLMLMIGLRVFRK